MAGDPSRANLAARVTECISSIEASARTLFSDISYALLRAKLLAQMVIDVIASAELLKQAGADPSRLDIAASFVRRRMLEAEHFGRRIDENAAGRLELDARVVAQASDGV
jgi:hypothetical protein